MKLNSNNYFSIEANNEYLSVSQYKNFLSCEARTIASLKGEYTTEKSKEALLFGKLLHSWNEHGEIKVTDKEMFCKTGKNKGQLKASYRKVYDLIDTIQENKLFLKALGGLKEVIFTANFLGAKWKICIDSYNPTSGYFTDLKAMANLHEKYWNKDLERYVDFITHYKYDLQMVVYSEVERIATKRNKNLSPYLAVITKQTPPDTAIYKGFLQYKEVILEEIQSRIPRIIDLKAGLTEPTMCNRCEYCRSVKETEIIDYIK